MAEPVGESLPAVGDRRLAVLLDLLPDVVLLLDAEGRVQWGNEAAERLFARKREDSIGISALEFIHHDDLELVLRSLASVQEKDVGTLIEVRVAASGGWKLVEVIGRPVPEVGQGSILFCIRDVTERRRFEVARDDVARFRSIVHNAALVTMLVSDEGVIESASAALTRFFGHDPESVEGNVIVELFSPEDRLRLEHSFETASMEGRSSGPVTVEAGLRRRHSAEVVPVELTIVSLLEDPTVGGYVVSMRDVTERKKLEEALVYQASHDHLTGLFNKELFIDQLRRAAARGDRSGTSALLFLDLDGLKVVNDRLGHVAGDRLLVDLADVLRSTTRSYDVVGRLGGDEFGVLIEDPVSRRDVVALAERILAGMPSVFSDGEQSLEVSISVGISFAEPGLSHLDVLRRADLAMYSAKQQGGGRWEVS
jgi:diguanylate cyclase (GGDEF)-like protein/PAS domain S-box-containing protein